MLQRWGRKRSFLTFHDRRLYVLLERGGDTPMYICVGSKQINVQITHSSSQYLFCSSFGRGGAYSFNLLWRCRCNYGGCSTENPGAADWLAAAASNIHLTGINWRLNLWSVLKSSPPFRHGTNPRPSPLSHVVRLRSWFICNPFSNFCFIYKLDVLLIIWL